MAFILVLLFVTLYQVGTDARTLYNTNQMKNMEKRSVESIENEINGQTADPLMMAMGNLLPEHGHLHSFMPSSMYFLGPWFSYLRPVITLAVTNAYVRRVLEENMEQNGHDKIPERDEELTSAAMMERGNSGFTDEVDSASLSQTDDLQFIFFPRGETDMMAGSERFEGPIDDLNAEIFLERPEIQTVESNAGDSFWEPNEIKSVTDMASNDSFNDSDSFDQRTDDLGSGDVNNLTLASITEFVGEDVNGN